VSQSSLSLPLLLPLSQLELMFGVERRVKSSGEWWMVNGECAHVSMSMGMSASMSMSMRRMVWVWDGRMNGR